jgi:beta-glucanase (GH16 family)
MVLRAVQGNDSFLVWYVILTTSPSGTDSNGGEEQGFVSKFQELSWSDEFNGDTLNANNWNYALGNGDNGWGNGEAQYYTNAEENVKVQDGNLVITAKRESENGFDFTSARITTKDKFEFTYGRVEVRAKLPAGGGTWPAIWMLGESWPEESWPGVGEMDIMEFAGNRPNTISSALHFPGNSGGNAITGEVSDAGDVTSEFHIYEVEWTEEKISFLMDGDIHLEFDNNDSTPFQKDFYLLLNVAMGGSYGGTIADDFQESSMEIDYLKVYK